MHSLSGKTINLLWVRFLQGGCGKCYLEVFFTLVLMTDLLAMEFALSVFNLYLHQQQFILQDYKVMCANSRGKVFCFKLMTKL